MGSVVVSSERPFGVTTSVRDYEAHTARLIRVFSPGGKAQFRKPRGLRFGPGGHLYCAAHDEVVGFDFETGPCLGAAVTLPRLNGQELVLFQNENFDLKGSGRGH